MQMVECRPKPAQCINLSLDAKAVDYFQLFFSDDLLLKIVDWTIQNGEKKTKETRRRRKMDSEVRRNQGVFGGYPYCEQFVDDTKK